MPKLKATLSEVKVGEKCHTILKTSSDLSENVDYPVENEDNASIFNVAMIDVSISMEVYWNDIMRNWNEHIAPKLKGSTKIFAFGKAVYFRRNGTRLENSDFYSETTNLTDAIATINSEIRNCPRKRINVFLVTDGDHTASCRSPRVEIAKLCVPQNKTVEVFLLGVGNMFPVEYSITIRSALHTGNANVPSLFWAKSNHEHEHELYHRRERIPESIHDEMCSIAEVLKSDVVTYKLSHPGYLAPGFPETHTLHGGEFIYFTRSIDELKSLQISVEDGPLENIEFSIEEMGIDDLLNSLFRQWNSIIIQRHRQKGEVPPTSFDIMEEIYYTGRKKLEEGHISKQATLKARLTIPKLKSIDIEFATLMNQSKTIIGLETKYNSEIELAEQILKTTVRGKYFHKNLKMKGHSANDYDNHMKQFSEIYEKLKNDIMALPDPSPDDCCRITLCSLLQDLKDSSFPELLTLDKFTFLKTITVTGLPVYAPVRDSSQINPWSLCVRNIVGSPFAIVSQNTLEISADLGNIPENSVNKEIYLKGDDVKTRFNAVVLVFTPEEAKVLKPLIRTNIFSMLASFCILKDPHIIDHDAHIAGLGCTWIKLLRDFPSAADRPEFVVEKLSLIQATAEIYLDRGDIDKYLKLLFSNPNEALMTESYVKYENNVLKCETLIKPMFLLYLIRDRTSTAANLLTILHLLVQEYIGRCMGNVWRLDTSYYIYSSLFCPVLRTQEARKAWIDKEVKEHTNQMLECFENTFEGRLLDHFYTVADLKKSLDAFCRLKFKELAPSSFEIALDEKAVSDLRSDSSTGNMRLSTLKTFAREMSLSEEVSNSLLDTKNLVVHVVHGLRQRHSRGRLASHAPTYDKALEMVRNSVKLENSSMFNVEVMKQIFVEADKRWRRALKALHESELMPPMIPIEIVNIASERGVQVTEENFENVFSYNPKTGLLRNACMTKSCPFYLKPNKDFNQHLSETRGEGYLHQIHKISREQAAIGGTADNVIQIIIGGEQSMNGIKINDISSSERLKGKINLISELIRNYALLVT